MVPYRLVDAQTDEPAEQQVELNPLHQLARPANAVERLQRHRPQQLAPAGSKAGQPGRIKLREIPVQRRQRRAGYRPDLPQRMTRTYPRLHIDLRKQAAATFVGTAQPSPPEPGK